MQRHINPLVQRSLELRFEIRLRRIVLKDTDNKSMRWYPPPITALAVLVCSLLGSFFPVLEFVYRCQHVSHNLTTFSL